MGNGKAFQVTIALVSVVTTIGFMILFKGVFADIKVGITERKPANYGGGRFEVTKVDWLALESEIELNHLLMNDNISDDSQIVIVGNNNMNTILVVGILSPNGNSDLLRRKMGLVSKVITQKAKAYGWDSWIKITEEIKQY